jgi:hypothetical protein
MTHRDLLFLARFCLGSNRVLKHLLALRPAPEGRIPNREKTVTPDMDVCIEGFPNSANTFMMHVVQTWNPDARLAHHVHVPLQLILAAEYGIPAVALIREPADAVTSIRVKNGRLSASSLLWVYEAFYGRIIPFARDLVFANFDDVTRSPDETVVRINEKYHKRLNYRRYDAAEKERIFAEINAEKVPKVPRSDEEIERRRRIRRGVTEDPRYPGCLNLYQTITAKYCGPSSPTADRTRPAATGQPPRAVEQDAFDRTMVIGR